MSAAQLVVDALSRAFGGVHAVDELSFELAAGKVHSIIGPNGAGKTTLLNLLSGVYVPSSGRVTFEGNDVTGFAPHALAARGMARTFQNLQVFFNMSALENVMVGRHVRTHAGIFGAILRGAGTRAEERAIHERAHALLDYVGLAARGNEIAHSLPYGDQRRLEIARALATEPKLLALDEPAAGMNATETATLRQLLERIRSDGTTLLLIEHDMKLVMGLCDRIAVLDYGRKIAEGAPAAVRKDAAVIEAYLGGELA